MIDSKISLDFNKSGRLSNFEIQKSYEDKYFTERLILKKEAVLDLVSVPFSVFIKESNEKVGEVILIYDGEIWYWIGEKFRKNGYATEAVSKLIKMSKRDYFYLSIRRNNLASKKVAKKLGFDKNKGKIWEYQKDFL